MINNCIFITENYLLLSKQINYPKERFTVSFVMKDVEFFDQLMNLHQSVLLMQPNIRFSIHLYASSISPLSDMDALLRLFFHPNYLKQQNKPVLSLYEADKNNSDLNRLLEILHLYAIDQGYEGIECIYFAEYPSNDVNNASICFQKEKSSADIETAYFELLSEKFYAASFVGIHSDDPEPFLNGLGRAEEKLIATNPNQYEALKKIKETVEENVKFQQELMITKQDLSNYKTYLKFYQDKDETVKIQEFYFYEYEILPAWYKKIGHLIKVLSGKRTFSSLFNNDVEKYKKSENIKMDEQ